MHFLSTSFKANSHIQLLCAIIGSREIHTVSCRTCRCFTWSPDPQVRHFPVPFICIQPLLDFGHENLDFTRDLLIPFIFLAWKSTHRHVVCIDCLNWLSSSDGRRKWLHNLDIVIDDGWRENSPEEVYLPARSTSSNLSLPRPSLPETSKP